MTLEEAIWKEEALAYSFGERYKRLGEPVGDLQELEAEHKQYAEWLRELKAYQNSPVLQRWLKQCDTCKYRHKKASEPPCRRCCHTYKNKYEYDETREQNLAYTDEPTMQSAT